jgi:sugar lactone lactonase YvrE
MSQTSVACASEGGEVLHTIELDRGCFAYALGGADRRMLFMMAKEWKGAEAMLAPPRTGQVLTAEAPAPAAGWP